MHFCPDCGCRCWCDGRKVIDAEGARTCVHCCGESKSPGAGAAAPAEDMSSETGRYLRAQAVGHRKERP